MTTSYEPPLVLYHRATNTLAYRGCYDAEAGAYVNTALVDVTLADSAGVPLAGYAWPVRLVYVPASEGDYTAPLSGALLPRRASLVAQIAVDAGGGLTDYQERPVEVRVRGRAP